MVRHVESILRVDVAKTELDVLEKAVRPVEDIESHTVYPESDPNDPKAVVFYALPGPRCEVRWSISIGEICHNLRAALDGIAWDYSTKPIPHGKRDKNTQFPIFLSRDRRWPGDDSCFLQDGTKRQTRRMTDVHRAFFETFQPYKRTNPPTSDPLYLLKEMNDTDKHRFLCTSALVAKDVVLSFPDGAPESVEIRKGTDFVRGAQLYGMTFRQDQRVVRMEAHIPLEVCFADRLRAIQGLPVINTLRAMHKTVNEIVQWFVHQSPPFSNAGLPPI